MGRSQLIVMTGSRGDRKSAKAATEAIIVSVGPHKGWTCAGAWNRTLVFSYKFPTTRLTVYFLCSPFSHLSAIALRAFASCAPGQEDQRCSYEFDASHVTGYRERLGF